MLIPFESLNEKYRFGNPGVLHVGAHEGEEADLYDSAGFSPVYWIEADPETCKVLDDNIKHRLDHSSICAVLADEPKLVTFHRANNGQSSSILEFGTHEKEHPEVKYVDEESRMATTVDVLLDMGLIDRCGFMNLDVQGAELMVLNGATDFLSTVDFIYSEVNKKELYKGCALIGDMDFYLGKFNFKRVETEWTRHGWGDALWVR